VPSSVVRKCAGLVEVKTEPCRGPALPNDIHVGTSLQRVHSDHDLGDDGPQELLALTPGRGRRVEHRPDICTGLLQPHHLFLRQRGGLAEALSREAGLGLALGHEGLFKERSSVRATRRFSGSTASN